MPDRESKRRWDKENTTVISLKLHNRNDADILEAVDGQQKQTKLKELIRIALQLSPEQQEALAEAAMNRADGKEWREATKPIQDILKGTGKEQELENIIKENEQ